MIPLLVIKLLFLGFPVSLHISDHHNSAFLCLMRPEEQLMYEIQLWVDGDGMR